MIPTISDEIRIYAQIHSKIYCFIVEDNGGSSSLLPSIVSSLNYLNGAIFVVRSDIPESLTYVEKLLNDENRPKGMLS